MEHGQGTRNNKITSNLPSASWKSLRAVAHCDPYLKVHTGYRAEGRKTWRRQGLISNSHKHMRTRVLSPTWLRTAGCLSTAWGSMEN